MWLNIQDVTLCRWWSDFRCYKDHTAFTYIAKAVQKYFSALQTPQTTNNTVSHLEKRQSSTTELLVPPPPLSLNLCPKVKFRYNNLFRPRVQFQLLYSAILIIRPSRLTFSALDRLCGFGSMQIWGFSDVSTNDTMTLFLCMAHHPYPTSNADLMHCFLKIFATSTLATCTFSS